MRKGDGRPPAMVVGDTTKQALGTLMAFLCDLVSDQAASGSGLARLTSALVFSMSRRGESSSGLCWLPEVVLPNLQLYLWRQEKAQNGQLAIVIDTASAVASYWLRFRL